MRRRNRRGAKRRFQNGGRTHSHRHSHPHRLADHGHDGGVDPSFPGGASGIGSGNCYCQCLFNQEFVYNQFDTLTADLILGQVANFPGFHWNYPSNNAPQPVGVCAPNFNSNDCQDTCTQTCMNVTINTGLGYPVDPLPSGTFQYGGSQCSDTPPAPQTSRAMAMQQVSTGYRRGGHVRSNRGAVQNRRIKSQKNPKGK